MALPNPGMDAVPFTPLTAEFLDDMIENIESLSSGTGIGDGAVTTAKIADGAVTSVKLAEAYARGRLQAITTNTAPTGLTIQEGWNYVTGTGTGNVTKAITFPVAFATGGLKSFKIGMLAARSGSDPTVLEGFNVAINSDIVQASFSGLSVTGFTVNVAAEVTRTLTSGVRYGFWWEAKGIV